MNKRLYSHPEGLSGGQKQRVVNAGALVSQPKIFLLTSPLQTWTEEPVEMLLT